MRVTSVRRLSILIVLAAAAAIALVATTQGSAAPRAHARAAKFPISQFTCYKGKFSTFKIHKFTISNQFDKLSAGYAVAPLRVCAPAIKNNEPIPDKVSHLVCFTLRVANGPTGSAEVVATDQFGAHRLTVVLPEPESICLPASKSRRGAGALPAANLRARPLRAQSAYACASKAGTRTAAAPAARTPRRKRGSAAPVVFRECLRET